MARLRHSEIKSFINGNIYLLVIHSRATFDTHYREVSIEDLFLSDRTFSTPSSLLDQLPQCGSPRSVKYGWSWPLPSRRPERPGRSAAQNEAS